MIELDKDIKTVIITTFQKVEERLSMLSRDTEILKRRKVNF